MSAPDPRNPEGAATHSAEQAIIEARRSKADRIRARGDNPFANDVAPRLAGSRTVDLGALRALAEPAKEGDRYGTDKVAAICTAQVFHVHGRVIAHRSTGGLSFLRLRDRTGELQLLVSEATLGADYGRLDEIDVGDVVEAEGTLTASKRGELSIEPRRVRLLTKALPAAPREVARPDRRRAALPPALRRPHRQPRGGRRLPRAQPHRPRATRQVLDDARLPRGRDADDAHAHRRRGGAPVHDAPQRARHARSSCASRPSCILEAARRRRARARLRDRALLPERGDLDAAQPRVHDARVLPGVRDLRRPDGLHRGLLRQIDAALALAMPAAHATWKAARPFTLDEPFVRVSMARAVAAAAGKTLIAPWTEVVADGHGRAARRPPARRLRRLASRSGRRASPRAKAIDWGNLRKALPKCDNDGERLFALYEYLAEPFLPEDYRSADGARSRAGLRQGLPVRDLPAVAPERRPTPSWSIASSCSSTAASCATPSAS